MIKTIVQQLADFTAHCSYAQLPAEVVEETKRIMLDSIGCALAGTEHPKGKIGIDYGRLTGGGEG
jgi:2-methylcitrate dehydratase PrpD